MGGGGGGGKRVRVMRADEEIELEEGESLGRRDVSAILGKVSLSVPTSCLEGSLMSRLVDGWELTD